MSRLSWVSRGSIGLLGALAILLLPADADGAKRGTAAINGTRLYYEVAGEGEPVVLLEGGQLDRRMWDEQFAAFALEYRVVRFDVRGFGLSAARSGPFKSHEDLFALLEFLGIPKAHLVGLSLGGRIAIDFALTHPEKVRSLVLAGPGLSGFPWSDRHDEWTDRIHRAVARGDGKAAALAWLDSNYMKPASTNPKTHRRLEELAVANARTWTEPDSEQELKPAAYDRLSEIRVPTLAIVGSLDNPDIHRIVDQLARDVPGARKIVIEGAGHMVNMEEPGRFNEIVLGFLRGLDGKSDITYPKSSATGSEPSDVRTAVEALRDAGLRRDVEALERLYAPDYFHTNPDGSKMGREQVLASYRTKPEMTITSVEADEWQAILRGPFAVASERVALHGRRANGNSFISRYRITYVLERRDQSWCFVNSHSSLLGI